NIEPKHKFTNAVHAELITFEFNEIQQLKDHLDHYVSLIFRKSIDPKHNLCKTAFLSHSALKSLYKIHTNNENTCNKILANETNVKWIEDNIKDYDKVLQEDVRKTGLMGKLWGADLRLLNSLNDSEVYL